MARKAVKVALWSLLGIVSAILLLVALLPAIVSTATARVAILKQVNSRIPGTLRISNWSLGWFSGVSLRGIDFADAGGMSRVRMERLSVPAGPLRLLGATKRMGHIELVKPDVALTLPAAGFAAAAAPEPVAAPGRPESGPAPERKRPAARKPLPFDVELKFDLSDGNIVVRKEDVPESLTLTNLNVSLDIRSLNRPMAFLFKTGLGQGGAIEAKGNASVFKDGLVDPAAISADAELKIESFSLGSVGGMAKAFVTNLPDIAGTLDAGVSLRMAGMKDIAATGKISTASFSVSGGPLGDERLSLARTRLTFGAGMKEDKLVLKDCELQTPIAGVKADGWVRLPEQGGGGIPDSAVTISAHVGLAEIARQIPKALKLKEGLKIAAGDIDADCSLDSAAGDVKVKGVVRIRDVAGEMNRRKAALSAPIEITALAALDKNGLRLDDLRVSSSFAKGGASGSAEAANVNLAVDIAAALAEARQFIELGGLDGSGKVTLTGAMSSPDKNSRKISARAEIADLQIRKPGMKTPLSEKRIAFDLASTVNLTPSNAFAGLSDTTAGLTSSFARVNVRSDGIRFIKGARLPDMDLRVNVESDLALLADMAGKVATNMPPGMKARGKANFSLDLAAKDDVANVQSLGCKVADFEFAMDGKRMAEKQIAVSGKAGIDMKKKSVSLDELAMLFSPGRIVVSGVSIPDWEQLPAGAVAHVEGDLNIGALTAMLGGFADLPAGTSVEGAVKLNLDLATRSKVRQEGKLSATVSGLAITPPKKPAVKEEKMELGVSVDIDSKAHNVTIPSLTVRSSPLGLSASAKFEDWTGEKNLEAKGEIAPDLARISEMIAALTGTTLDMAGRNTDAFTIKTSLKGKSWQSLVRRTVAEMKLRMDRLAMFGLKITNMGVPIEVSGGMAKVSLSADVNDGKLLAAPVLDASGETAVFRLPDNSTLITDVRLDSAIANELLGKLHPIFRGCAVTAGKLTLEMNKLYVPLDATMKTNTAFEGKILLKGLSMGPAGLLSDILSLCGTGARSILPGDQSFGFSCRKGRVYPDPITIKSGDDRLVFRGSVGLDQTLDYYVEIPITRGMVGGDVYDVLKGETISVPIGGTATRPRLAKDAFQKILADLVKKAAGKTAVKLIERELIKGLFK